MNPPPHEQVRVPNRSIQRPPQSPISQVENVLQSIEQASHPTSQNQKATRPSYTQSPAQVRYFNTSETQGGPVFYHVDRSMNDEQYVVKRRRVNQGHNEMLDSSHLHNDLQRSLLVPVGHTHRHEFSDRTPSIRQRSNGLEPSIRTERLQDAREVYRISTLEQRDVSSFHPIYPEHVRPSGTQVPHHGQILLTQQQLSSDVSARSPVQHTIQKAVPDFDDHRSVQNVSYLSRNSYVSLPREDLRTSHSSKYDVNRRTAQDSPPWDENERVPRPVLDHATEVKGYLPPHSVFPQMKPRISAEQSRTYLLRDSPVQIPPRRWRKALPLEKSFEHLRSVQNHIPSGETYRVDGSLQAGTFDQVVTVKSTPASQAPWPQIQRQHDFASDHIQHGEKQRLVDVSVHEEDRWAFSCNRHLSIADLPCRTHRIYPSDIEPRKNTYLKEISPGMTSGFLRPVVRMPSLSDRQQGVLDKHNGRQVIVLE